MNQQNDLSKRLRLDAVPTSNQQELLVLVKRAKGFIRSLSKDKELYDLALKKFNLLADYSHLSAKEFQKELDALLSSSKEVAAGTSKEEVESNKDVEDGDKSNKELLAPEVSPVQSSQASDPSSQASTEMEDNASFKDASASDSASDGISQSEEAKQSQADGEAKDSMDSKEAKDSIISTDSKAPKESKEPKESKANKESKPKNHPQKPSVSPQRKAMMVELGKPLLPQWKALLAAKAPTQETLKPDSSATASAEVNEGLTSNANESDVGMGADSSQENSPHPPKGKGRGKDGKGGKSREKSKLKAEANELYLKDTESRLRRNPLDELAKRFLRAEGEAFARLGFRPIVSYPDDLPISKKIDDIREMLDDNPVIIVSGDTGSGKSTQLPKICMELGLGRKGMIAHTQPRRIAARSIAKRLADETGGRFGHEIGFRIRFTNKTDESTMVCVLTDGVLLNEIKSDPDLLKYDAIIIDEAHERSLNIDFLMGYMKNLVKRRRDLKVIITSATIDAERFGEFFDGAPHIHVEGKTYPVEIIYAPVWGLDALGGEGNYGAALEEEIEDLDDEGNIVVRRKPGVSLAAQRNMAMKAGKSKDKGKSKGGANLMDDEPPSYEDLDINDAIYRACEELFSFGNGDILVFLPGEREIHEAMQHLEDIYGGRHLILPLFSRMQENRQDEIFKPKGGRNRIILSTNVAETSITVPGIRYVVDTGVARINRYSARSKVEQLNIENISKASARQRSGRCGRLRDGIAIRLYSEADYESRPDYSDPEIIRSNLSSVILRMLDFNLGDISEFPFIDPPQDKFIRDGQQTLFEIGAVDEFNELTDLGRLMTRIHADPKVARILLESIREGVSEDVLVIASALSVQDPRVRPFDERENADRAHEPFKDKNSDFMSHLYLWDFYEKAKIKAGSRRQLQKILQKQYLSYPRMIEWRELYKEFKEFVDGAIDNPLLAPKNSKGQSLGKDGVLEVGKDGKGGRGSHPQKPGTQGKDGTNATTAPNGKNGKHANGGKSSNTSAAMSSSNEKAKSSPAASGSASSSGSASESNANPGKVDLFEKDKTRESRYDAIHRSLLAGLISNTGMKSPEGMDYLGSRGQHFYLFPGSHVFKSKPRWVVVNELVDTSKLYARTVAKIDPEWIEKLAPHLVKYHYFDPHWEEKRGEAQAYERVSLFGLTIIPRRKVSYGRIDPEESRNLLIMEGLVHGHSQINAPFMRHNQELIKEIRDIEHRTRKMDILADDEVMKAFYSERIPQDVVNVKSFLAWLKEESRKDPDILKMSVDDVTLQEANLAGEQQFPKKLKLPDGSFPLHYRFEPRHPLDGITMDVPVPVLNRLPRKRLEWLVPGMIREKLQILLKALPKSVRRVCVPIPQFVTDFLSSEPDMEDSIFPQLAKFIGKRHGDMKILDDIDMEAWRNAEYPEHIFMNFRVVDDKRQEVAMGRDLSKLKDELGDMAEEVFRDNTDAFEVMNVKSWSFGDISQSVRFARGKQQLNGWLGLKVEGGKVNLRLFDTRDNRDASHLEGVLKLVEWALPDQARDLKKGISRHKEIALNLLGANVGDDLNEDIMRAVFKRSFFPDGPQKLPMNKEDFAKGLAMARENMADVKTSLAKHLWDFSREYHELAKLMERHPIEEEIRDQLDTLVYPGFVHLTPFEKWPRMTIYIRAMINRLGKYSGQPQRDEEFEEECMRQYDRWCDKLDELENGGYDVSEEIRDFFWDIQELRVSLFAQELKTPTPVSVVRLDKKWDKITRSY